jgi:hypothetical protein
VRQSHVIAGAGAIAFGVLTFLAFVVANPPGSTYKASDVERYLATGHRVSVIVAMYLGWLGVLGLICLLAHLRGYLGGVSGDSITRSVFWGAGIAAAASFALGWSVDGGQIIAHLEGGKSLAVSPQVTHLISEVGSVLFIFGSGSALLGFGLIALALGSQQTLPRWLRWTTLVAGVCGVAGPAFFTFYLVLVWSIVVGGWLLLAGRVSSAETALPSAPRR